MDWINQYRVPAQAPVPSYRDGGALRTVGTGSSPIAPIGFVLEHKKDPTPKRWPTPSVSSHQPITDRVRVNGTLCYRVVFVVTTSNCRNRCRHAVENSES